MCDALYLRYNIIAKCNYKIVSTLFFHGFLNKSQIITSNDCVTDGVFVETGITAAYVWNSALIDDTDIICSIPAIGQEYRFPLNIEL